MPLISWSTHTLKLTEGMNALRPSYIQERNDARSAGKVRESINIHGRIEVDADLWLFGSSEYRKLVGFWSYARQGQTFSYAQSTSEMTNVVIASTTAVAGSSSVKVSSSGDIAAGHILYIQALDNDDEFELVKVSSISSTTVTFDSKLLYSYSTSDTVRSERYYPSVVLSDDSFNPTPVTSTNQPSSGIWKFKLKFEESS